MIDVPLFRWPGGKSQLSPEIVKRIPRRGRKFIELCGGRGNVTFRAMAEDLDYQEWVINDPLTAPFFIALRDFGDRVKVRERSRKEFLRMAQLAKTGDPEAILLEPWLAFNGGTYDSGGVSTTGGRRTPESYERSLRVGCKLMRERNVKITALDWFDCLEAEQPGPEDFVFIDIPYIGCEVAPYKPTSVSPTEIIEVLKSATFNWIFTEYRQPLYLAAFGEPAFQKNVQLRTTNFAKTGGQERRVECIWTSNDIPKRDTVAFQSVPADRQNTFYSELQWNELLCEIKQCIAAITASRNQMSMEMRKRLLPALQELKKRTFRKDPNFYETLRQMGLNPDTVRQWFYRGRIADEVIELLEEESTAPSLDERTQEDDEPSLSPDLLRLADDLAVAVLSGQPELAKQLATAYATARRLDVGVTGSSGY
jgi:hypothetical protein